MAHPKGDLLTFSYLKTYRPDQVDLGLTFTSLAYSHRISLDEFG
jgi:hypothetical protein